MSSMNPGNGYVPNGSVGTMPLGQPIPGMGVGSMSPGALSLANGGKGKSMTTQGPLKPAAAKGAAKVKNGKKK